MMNLPSVTDVFHRMLTSKEGFSFVKEHTVPHSGLNSLFLQVEHILILSATSIIIVV